MFMFMFEESYSKAKDKLGPSKVIKKNGDYWVIFEKTGKQKQFFDRIEAGAWRISEYWEEALGPAWRISHNVYGTRAKEIKQDMINFCKSKNNTLTLWEMDSFNWELGRKYPRLKMI